MRIDVLTTFPEMFPGPLQASIIGRAVKAGLVDVHLHNLRDYTESPQRKTDDTQFGGGSGMVMNALPVIRCVEFVRDTELDPKDSRVIFLTPQGETLTQPKAREISLSAQIILICGHYKGLDERAVEYLKAEEISIGDYVLSGGEIPALVLIDALVRLLPGSVGSFDSVEEDSFYDGLLDAPRYTQPRAVRGLEVPEALLSGDHARIEEWRHQQALERTRIRRPDLYEKWRQEHE